MCQSCVCLGVIGLRNDEPCSSLPQRTGTTRQFRGCDDRRVLELSDGLPRREAIRRTFGESAAAISPALLTPALSASLGRVTRPGVNDHRALLFQWVGS